jgi:signal transduction histidine kinase
MLGRIARKCRGTPWRALAPTEEEPPAPAPEQELRNSGTQELWKSESAGPGARSLEPGATNAPSVSPEPDTGAPPDTLVADLEEVRQLAQKTLDRIRTQSRMLHPVILDDFGLEHAVKWYVDEFSRQHGVAASYATEGALGALPSETAVHLYRIVQEALTNVARHARAGRAAVRLSKGDGEVVLEVEDNGVGLPLDSGPGARAASSSIGVTSMRERAELMGGSFALGRPESGQGVLVRVRVPLEKGQLS